MSAKAGQSLKRTARTKDHTPPERCQSPPKCIPSRRNQAAKTFCHVWEAVTIYLSHIKVNLLSGS
jgi:hypothetical protein